ncbi:hypothetical protein CC1G_14532 [Coprinopsis cinerea okayama7|uniref:Uncharacterized protein n=1 Tax=Coprinopsis cinerea (strain Okayama-7 / 130 / ATCC MYA-4618 / FGSC 9003) TaxID=240176 RepID=D6RMY0_COPC7|nr:hypothetical protein CC1G_14532 [Coprinopsis cinerea okayama7\|eukprot:XP_002911100.1 hypothetical protein CC1G_14532 [Coprinopsis cinerea okayama7\
MKRRIWDLVKYKPDTTGRGWMKVEGKMVFEHVRRGVDEELCLRILDECNFSLARLRDMLGSNEIIERIMAAHLEPMMYSVDLAGSVLRQGTFVKKIADFGWIRPGFFDTDDDEAALHRAVARYHAQVKVFSSYLLASNPGSFFVPTLDIDLVWHTHQLRSVDYAADCTTYVGRFIDHDDKVDGLKLSSSFDATCRAWKRRFGISYTYCGCPPPGDTIGQRLSTLIASQPISPSRSLGSHLSPPTREDSILATHPSDHNAVHFVPRDDQAKREFEARLREHHAKQQRRGNRSRGRKGGRGDGFSSDDHERAFLYPVAMFDLTSNPASCVAVHGIVIDYWGNCDNEYDQCGSGGCTTGLGVGAEEPGARGGGGGREIVDPKAEWKQSRCQVESLA